MNGRTRIALVALVAVSAGLLVAYLNPWHSTHVPESWKTVTVRGTSADIPPSWKPVKANECGFLFAEHAPKSTTCVLTPGLSIFGSALFDPAALPGLRSQVIDGRTVWFGYVYVGNDMVVSASSVDRRVTDRVLSSARVAGHAASSPSTTSASAGLGTVHATLFVTGGPPPGLRRPSSSGRVFLGGPEPNLPTVFGDVGKDGSIDFRVEPGRYSVGGRMGSVLCSPSQDEVTVEASGVTNVQFDCSIK